MKCPRCRTIHSEPTKSCRRCDTALPQPRCKKCKATVDWGRSWCDRHQPEELRDDDHCPACGVRNDPGDDYCADCGSPMAVITRVIETTDGPEHPDPWRVYGVETNLVGRDDELQALEEALDKVQETSAPRVAALTARQGLGKSRLLAEFQDLLEASFAEAAVLRGVCRKEVGGAFSVIAGMLRTRFYIGDDDRSDAARRRFFDAVDALVDDGAEEITALVGEVIGFTADDAEETTGRASPKQRERATFQAVADLIRADARRTPLVLIFDDFHLASDPTHRLVRHLIEALDNAPVLFVFGQTDDRDSGIPSERADLHLQLAPLSDTEVRRQLRDTLRLADDVPDKLVDKIVDAALGNPLAVEEILRIFISEGIVDTRRQPWKIDTGRIDEIDLPTTVEETVEARLDGLTDAERRTLEMAACVGTLFWGELIRCLDRQRKNATARPSSPWIDSDGQKPHEPVDDIIESLERKDMIRRRTESRLRNQEEFFFKHRLERQALYDKLPTHVRKRYHRLIAQWLERQNIDGSDNAAEFIARHHARAQSLRRAARYFLEAGDGARRQHANREAIELYLEAMGCLTDADIDLKLRACHDVGSLHDLLGEHRQAKTYFEDMARSAWVVGDRSKLGAALNRIGRTLRQLGDYDASLQHFERALDLFRDADDDRGVASTLDDIGKIAWVRGDQKKALEYYEAALEMRRSLGNRRSIALSLSHIGSVKISLGEPQAATEYLKSALELRKELDDPRGLASSYNDFGGLCIERGDYERALPLLDKALGLARQVGFRGLQSAILDNMGEALIELKRRDEAQKKLEKARDIAADIGQRRILFDAHRNLARLAVSEARRELALERIERALELADELDSRSYIAIAELTRAEIHAEYVFDPSLKDESIAEATAAFERAISLLEETDVGIQLAHALSSYGHFLVERDNPETARRALERARDLFDDADITEQREEIDELLAHL